MNTQNLVVRGLSKSFHSGSRTTHTLNDINLSLFEGETLGITGPSGCGKSTLARCILRLIDPDKGEVIVGGRNWLQLNEPELRIRRRDMQMVFQNSAESFNHFATVKTTLIDPLRIHDIVPRTDFLFEAERLLNLVGLSPDLMARKMSSLSGGQRQRVAIARALASGPKILILDEAVSALDMAARQAILELLTKLQANTGLSALFISHDFAAINAVCHRVAVMDRGRIIEEGDTRTVVNSPQHPLTQSLLDAVPRVGI